MTGVRTVPDNREPLVFWRDFPRLQEALLLAVLTLERLGDEETLRRIEQILGLPGR